MAGSQRGPAIRRSGTEGPVRHDGGTHPLTNGAVVADEGHSRIAVLIDADNTSARHARDLFEEIAKYGVTTVKRAYGDWTTTQLAGWKDELNRSAITPIQQFAYTRGKNSTDSALIIDAMDLLYSDKLDAFAIVSSDSDFTRLATRLRESGKTVLGLGQRKTPESFRSACDRFIFLEVLSTKSDEESDKAEAAAEEATGAESGDDGEIPLVELRRLLLKAVESTSQDDGWTTLSGMGNYLSNSTASFDPRNYGYSKLSTLVRAQEYLDLAEPESGNGPMRVRVTPRRRSSGRSGAAKKAAGSGAAKKAAAKGAGSATTGATKRAPRRPATKRASAS